MSDFLAFLFAMYTIASFLFSLFVLFNHEEIFEKGFKVKHLILSIVFLPTTIFALFATAVGLSVIKIAEFFENRQKLKKFLNKRLF
jgi:hypothetical protein